MGGKGARLHVSPLHAAVILPPKGRVALRRKPQRRKQGIQGAAGAEHREHQVGRQADQRADAQQARDHGCHEGSPVAPGWREKAREGRPHEKQSQAKEKHRGNQNQPQDQRAKC